ncbi:MAG TPA: cyclic nucleotide-binding domain-containing protein [Actinomycetota bacterium]|nr:cyclic nucleotide-binding domain-containing protein [Actinomycetota bacterium]
MQYVVLVGIVIAALVIGVDMVRVRRQLRRRLDVRTLLTSALKERAVLAAPDLTELLRAAPEEDATAADVWGDVDDALDLERFRPKLAEGAELRIFRLRWGNDYAVIATPDHEHHYILEAWEGELVREMDGSKTAGELVVARLSETGDLDAGSVLSLIELLRLSGVFEPPPVKVDELIADRIDPASPHRRQLRSFVRTLKLSWHGVDRLVSWCYDHGIRACFTPAGAIILGAISVAGLVAFLWALTSHHFRLIVGPASVQTLILLVLGLILTAAHELGHASVIKHYGKRIPSAGFLVYFGSPAFYVDAVDGLLLDRNQRMLQAFAGPFAESCLAGIASVLLLLRPDASFAPFLFKFAVINYYVIFLNLIPLLELDGYWILTDAIEVPDLRARSLAFVQHDLWHKLRTHAGFTLQEVALGVYAFAGIAFTIFTVSVGVFFWKALFGNLVVELWDGGIGSRLLLILLVLFFTGPAIRGLIALGRALWRRVRAVWRRIRFRLETSWRVEAAELIEALPGFEEVPVDVLNDLAGRVRLRTYASNQPVFFAGDRPDAFFIVRRGRFAVEDVDPKTGDTVVLREMERGASFGELGLLTHAARATTIRAVGSGELFEVDRTTFERLLADSVELPDFGPTMVAIAELKTLPPFRALSNDALVDLLARGSWIAAAPGEVLVSQGDVGDAFYVLGSGHVDVEQDGRTLHDMGPGEHFGEIALLEDVPRTASVIARTPVRAFRLDQEGFDGTLRDSFSRGTLRRQTDRTWEH